MHRGLSVLLLMSLSITPLTPLSPALAQEETAESLSSLVLIPAESTRFNEFLLRGLEGELEQFETSSVEGISGNIGLLFQNLKSRSAEFEGRADEEILEVEGQSLTVAQARKISQAQTLVAPSWQFSPVDLKGPEQVDGNWQLSAESTLKVTLQVYSALAPDSPKEVQGSWRIKKALPIADIDAIVAVVQQTTGEKPDPTTPEGRASINKALLEIEIFKQLLASDPATVMGEVAELQLQSFSMASLAKKLTAPAPTPTKTPSPTHQAGDGIGMNIGLRGGTMSMGFWGLAPQYFVPMGELVVDYDIGQFFNFPDFFITAAGGATLPQPAFGFTQPSFGVGVPTTTLTLSPQDQIFGFHTELGLTKNFSFGNFVLSLTARGGMQGGLIFESFPQQFGAGPPMAMAFGGTALIGGRYQITPNFMVGVDGGFRYFDQGYFATNQGFGPQPYPQTQSTFFQSIGPIASVYTGFSF